MAAVQTGRKRRQISRRPKKAVVSSGDGAGVGFSEDDYNVTVADKNEDIKKMLLKLKEVGKAPEFVAQQLTNLDKDVASTRKHAATRRSQVEADEAELAALAAQIATIEGKLAPLRASKAKHDEDIMRVSAHLEGALGQMGSHVKGASVHRKRVVQKQTGTEARLTRAQLSAERGYDIDSKVPTARELAGARKYGVTHHGPARKAGGSGRRGLSSTAPAR